MSAIEVEVEAGVAVLQLNRPPVNALSSQLYEELIETMHTLGDDSSIQVTVLSSRISGIFCAGADIKELRSLSGDAAREMDEERQRLARTVFEAVLNVPQPTIAAVGGAALGAGAVIASCCDIRIGSSSARFALPEIDIARCGGGRHLMRHLPQGVVRKMFFTGQPLGAEEALRYGFLQELTAPGGELTRAVEIAREIAVKSPLALRLGKRSLNRSESLPVTEGYALEQEYTLRLARSADAVEATRAFVEKRVPRFEPLSADSWLD